MMASVEKKKGRSARHVLRSDTCITPFIFRLCSRKYPSHPFPQPSAEKNLRLFFPVSHRPSRYTAAAPLVFSSQRIRGIYQQSLANLTQKYTWRCSRSRPGTGWLSPRVAPTVAQCVTTLPRINSQQGRERKTRNLF